MDTPRYQRLSAIFYHAPLTGSPKRPLRWLDRATRGGEQRVAHALGPCLIAGGIITGLIARASDWSAATVSSDRQRPIGCGTSALQRDRNLEQDRRSSEVLSGSRGAAIWFASRRAQVPGNGTGAQPLSVAQDPDANRTRDPAQLDISMHRVIVFHS